MCQLFTILLETIGRYGGINGRMSTIEQDALSIDTLCQPEIFHTLTQILQTEVELLALEVKQIAWSLGVIPASHL